MTEIDLLLDLVDEWHNKEKCQCDQCGPSYREDIPSTMCSDIPLHEFLGVTRKEYGQWLQGHITNEELLKLRKN